MGAPHAEDMAFGPDGLIYPGTCRSHNYDLSSKDLDTLNLRLSLNQIQHDITPITHSEYSDISFSNRILSLMTLAEFQDRIGEIVLWRKGYAAYHLASVIDDAHQGITHIIRGQDLMEATHIHVLLQTLLGVPTPAYHHHDLIRDENGKRLAKRHDAKAIRKSREDGAPCGYSQDG